MWKITWFSLVMERKYSNLRLLYKIKMPPKNNYVYPGSALSSLTALHTIFCEIPVLIGLPTCLTIHNSFIYKKNRNY